MKLKSAVLIFVLLSLLNQSCTKMKDPYPFLISKENFSVVADLESHEMMEKYYPLFIKHGLSGNGPSWEAVIQNILENDNPSLLNQLDFDSEAGAFHVYCESEFTLISFINILSPIFSDVEKLESHIENLDKTTLDD